MSVEFLAGFVSGIAGLVIGSPLDVLKTRQQQRGVSSNQRTGSCHQSWFAGLLAPIFSLGIMNAILFWSYHLVMQFLNGDRGTIAIIILTHCFLAGAFAGLCVCFVSVPTELVKVIAQSSDTQSTQVFVRVFTNHGLKGFYRGFWITVSRDSIGYGFYFLANEGLNRLLPFYLSPPWTILISGGLAGCISWFSIFPLDTVKTRMQAEVATAARPLLLPALLIEESTFDQSPSTYECAKAIYCEGGIAGFFAGLSAAMTRAFCVNAVIFWTDRWITTFLKQALGR